MKDSIRETKKNFEWFNRGVKKFSAMLFDSDSNINWKPLLKMMRGQRTVGYNILHNLDQMNRIAMDLNEEMRQVAVLAGRSKTCGKEKG